MTILAILKICKVLACTLSPLPRQHPVGIITVSQRVSMLFEELVVIAPEDFSWRKISRFEAFFVSEVARGHRKVSMVGAKCVIVILVCVECHVAISGRSEGWNQ